MIFWQPFRTILGPAVVVCIASLLQACGSLREPEAVADATPPAGYAPVYIRANAPIPKTRPSSARAEVLRIDTRDPSTVKLYVNIVDSTGLNFIGARSMICAVVDSVDGEKRTVTKQLVVREVTEADRIPTAVALVSDNSGSMGETRARAVQDALSSLFDQKISGDALAVVRYDEKTSVEVPLSTSPTELKNNLRRDGLTGFGGYTAIHTGIAAAIEHLNNAPSTFTSKLIIVFTDGWENSSKISKDSIIQRAIETKTTICAVDFGENVNDGYMESIARATGGIYTRIYGTSEFKPMFEDVYRRIKNHYVVEIPAETYGRHTSSVRICWPKDTLQATVEYDNTPDVGAIAVLGVQFDYDKAVIKKESDVAIRNVARLMKAFPNMEIELRGHTDNRNSTADLDYNRKLSEKRAQAVRDAIVARGIDAHRVTALGFGDTVPIADNNTETGRARNRRTEFVILRK